MKSTYSMPQLNELMQRAYTPGLFKFGRNPYLAPCTWHNFAPQTEEKFYEDTLPKILGRQATIEELYALDRALLKHGYVVEYKLVIGHSEGVKGSERVINPRAIYFSAEQRREALDLHKELARLESIDEKHESLRNQNILKFAEGFTRKPYASGLIEILECGLLLTPVFSDTSYVYWTTQFHPRYTSGHISFALENYLNIHVPGRKNQRGVF